MSAEVGSSIMPACLGLGNQGEQSLMLDLVLLPQREKKREVVLVVFFTAALTSSYEVLFLLKDLGAKLPLL